MIEDFFSPIIYKDNSVTFNLESEFKLASLCEIMVRKKGGRSSPNEITIFDSTGLSLQDIATASIVYEYKEKNYLL